MLKIKQKLVSLLNDLVGSYEVGTIYKIMDQEGYVIFLNYTAYNIFYDSKQLQPFLIRKKNEIISKHNTLDQAIDEVKLLDQLSKNKKPRLFSRLIHK